MTYYASSVILSLKSQIKESLLEECFYITRTKPLNKDGRILNIHLLESGESAGFFYWHSGYPSILEKHTESWDESIPTTHKVSLGRNTPSLEESAFEKCSDLGEAAQKRSSLFLSLAIKSSSGCCHHLAHTWCFFSIRSMWTSVRMFLFTHLRMLSHIWINTHMFHI